MAPFGAHFFTTWLCAADVLELKFVSPPYIADTECVPTASFEVVKVACRLPPTAPVPRTVAVVLSRNVTVPVGAPVKFRVMVAVKVTACPLLEGFGEEASAVVVDAFFTVCAKALDVLAAKFADPLYTAFIEWAPAASAEVVSVAVPPLSATVPNGEAPSSKVTIPVGVPAPDVTLEVIVTDCPKVDGFLDEATEVAVGAGLTT